MSYTKMMYIFLVVCSIICFSVDTTQAFVPKVADTQLAVSHIRRIVDPISFIETRIKLFEGFKSFKYNCGVSGVVLQGYGRSIGKKKTPNKISQETATQWLRDDIQRCVNDLDTHLSWWRNLSSIRQAALIDLTYNMGIHKLKTFKNFLSSLQKGEYKKAQSHLKNSRYYNQVGIRAKEIVYAIGTDMWKPMKT